MNDPEIYRIDDVVRVYRLSRSSVYRQIAEGRFPKPIHLTPRTRGWRRADLDQWAENLANPGGQLPLFPPDGEGRS